MSRGALQHNHRKPSKVAGVTVEANMVPVAEERNGCEGRKKTGKGRTRRYEEGDNGRRGNAR